MSWRSDVEQKLQDWNTDWKDFGGKLIRLEDRVNALVDRLRALEGARVATSPLMQLLCSPPPWHAYRKREEPASPPKPEPMAETCDSCGRAIEGCGYIVGTSHVCSGCKGPIPSPAPKPGEVWMYDGGVRGCSAVFVQHVFDADDMVEGMFAHESGAFFFSFMVGTSYLRRPANEMEERMFWRRKR